MLPEAIELENLDLTAPPEVRPEQANGINVEFVGAVGPSHIAMRVHERGVGETRSCGTGAAAAALSDPSGPVKRTSRRGGSTYPAARSPSRRSRATVELTALPCSWPTERSASDALRKTGSRPSVLLRLSFSRHLREQFAISRPHEDEIP